MLLRDLDMPCRESNSCMGTLVASWTTGMGAPQSIERRRVVGMGESGLATSRSGGVCGGRLVSGAARLGVQLAVWLIGTRLISPFPDTDDVVASFEMTVCDGLAARVGDRDRFNSHLSYLAAGDAPQDK
jgi:hypothetical protein